MIKHKSLVSPYCLGPTGIKNTKKVQQLLKQQIIRNSGEKKGGGKYKSSTNGKIRKNLSKLFLDCSFASERAPSVSCPGITIRNHLLFQLGFSNLGH